MNRKIISIFIIAVMLMGLILPVFNLVLADTIQAVVSLGADLTIEQQKQMLDYMNVDRDDINLVTVTNEEEAAYLKGTSAVDKIGTRAISSAYVEELEKGKGISVETYNITWVSEDMYANALVTAGVKDARVIAAAPFKVSGTAALTGIIKAFEEITGRKLDEDAKRIANEEMVVTGKLGEELGDKKKASELVKRVKEEVVEKGITDREDIKRIILEIQQDLNIKLDETQIQQLLNLMDKLKNIDINLKDLKEQVTKIGEKVRDIAEGNEEVKSFLQKIVDLLNQLVQGLLNIFR